MTMAKPVAVRAIPQRRARRPEEEAAGRKAEPLSKEVAGVRPSRRTVHQIDTETTTTEISQPMRRLVGTTCRLNIAVPTAGSQSVRRPTIMRAAYPTPAARPMRAPRAAITPPSASIRHRTLRTVNPTDKSKPISPARASTPRPNSRPTNIAADTIRKKLKPTKRPLKSVAPVAASRPSALTSRKRMPNWGRFRRPSRAWENVVSKLLIAGDCKRIEVTLP